MTTTTVRDKIVDVHKRPTFIKNLNGTPLLAHASLATSSGRYNVLEVLDEGLQGIVYKATDSQTEKPVVIKAMKGYDAFLIFNMEVFALTSLHHPNIIRIRDYGEHNGVYFIVFEHFEGKNLNSALKTGLSKKAKLDALIGICAAIQAVHAAGLLHLDLKPDNVLVNKGEVKLLDFGLATIIGWAKKPGILMGTPGYIAPEIIGNGERKETADVYSMGVLAYEILVGKKLFHGGELHEILENQMNNPITPPSVYNPDIPAGIDLLLLRTLSIEPEKRIQSADEFIHELLKYKRWFEAN